MTMKGEARQQAESRLEGRPARQRGQIRRRLAEVRAMNTPVLGFEFPIAGHSELLPSCGGEELPCEFLPIKANEGPR
jgi:hypothetical protein